MKDLAELQALDAELADLAPRIRVLSSLIWPAEVEARFLSAWRAGRAELPRFEPDRQELGAEIGALEGLMARCDPDDPLGAFLFRTARSYLDAAHMLEGVGTPEFTRWSVALYGRPDDSYRTQTVTALDAAEELLRTTDELLAGRTIPPVVCDIPAKAFGERLQSALDGFFTDDRVRVVVDPDLPSKAIAGSRRIRLRASALFSEFDLAQLWNHEALVHSLTVLNGKKQPHLRSLGLGAPRTTRTQEGLAVLSELATLAIDIVRLRRVALRVRAIDRALHGADFLEVFHDFLAAGQGEEESFKSAQRVFRGGGVRGGVVSTKDCVYLKGLLEVHTFLRAAVRDNRPDLVSILFAGRLTLGDALALAPCFESGLLAPPTYVPPWARDLGRVAANLAYSAFVARIDLGAVELARFGEREEELRQESL